MNYGVQHIEKIRRLKDVGCLAMLMCVPDQTTQQNENIHGLLRNGNFKFLNFINK